jgi:phosphoglycolate phosphatase-like HAD superfamily hydrolase
VKHRAWIFDIDGTLANTDHRIHHIKPVEGQKKSWGSFFREAYKDKPYDHVLIINQMVASWGVLEADKIVVMTARPEDRKEDTIVWLEEHGVKYDMLFMRPVNERKPDYEVKRDLYREHLKDSYEIVCAFEDRLQVAKMWREEGIPVLLCGDHWLNGDWEK